MPTIRPSASMCRRAAHRTATGVAGPHIVLRNKRSHLRSVCGLSAIVLFTHMVQSRRRNAGARCLSLHRNTIPWLWPCVCQLFARRRRNALELERCIRPQVHLTSIVLRTVWLIGVVWHSLVVYFLGETCLIVCGSCFLTDSHRLQFPQAPEEARSLGDAMRQKEGLVGPQRNQRDCQHKLA